MKTSIGTYTGLASGGRQWAYTCQHAMFYPNAYLTFNSNGNYTKHYYNGNERMASRIGENSVDICLNNTNSVQLCNTIIEERFRADLQQLVSTDAPVDMPPLMDVNTLQATGTPNDIFYYHTNHLGSTAFVTDGNATVTQGFLYAPFGEIVSEYNAGFANGVMPKYTFNAKELDEETGMYYYEARYYNSPVFTSRDPLFEKYFWMTPYAYCANNPVKYVDPTGMLYDESQRRAAIAKANEYEMKNRVDVTKPSGKGNSYNTYKLGAKGNPGQAVDCSGLTSACIVAGGEPDPVGKYSGGGVSQTVQGTEKIDDVNDVEEGNLIVFNNQKHIGIIIEKIYDKENNIIGFKMIHSSGDIIYPKIQTNSIRKKRVLLL